MEYLVDTKECPPIDHFQSKLSEKTISEDDYNSFRKNWQLHGFKNMLDCVKYYVLQGMLSPSNLIISKEIFFVVADTVWLAEIWTNFADYATKAFKLSLDHYITLPSYAYDCCLFMTQVELELVSDRKMYNFILEGKRG